MSLGDGPRTPLQQQILENRLCWVPLNVPVHGEELTVTHHNYLITVRVVKHRSWDRSWFRAFSVDSRGRPTGWVSCRRASLEAVVSDTEAECKLRAWLQERDPFATEAV